MGCVPGLGDSDPADSSEESGEPTTGAASSATADTEASGDTDPEPTSGPSSTTEGIDTEGETAGEAEPLPNDGMFGCGLPSRCPEITWHLDPYDDPEAVRCAAELIVSGQPGVLRAADVPGPGGWEEETILFVEGDGTALMQTRERSCPDDDWECDLDSQPWQGPWSTSDCEILLVEQLVTSCAIEGDDGCRWWPWGNLSCTSTADPVCEDLQAMLDGN